MKDTNWRINAVTISPFPRLGKGTEQHPSFLIGTKGGGVSFIDFSDTEKRGDCFTFVKLLHHMSSMDDVLKKIDQDFGLGISGTPLGDYKKIISEYKQPEEIGKRYSLIQASTRRFTQEELAYWNQYHQSLDDLRANNVHSIKELFFNKSKFMLKDTELRFGYLYDGHWKIYRPFADKKNKWVPNNVPITALDGQDGIKCTNLMIQKSKKDFMVMNKVYPYNVAVQNEGMACFSHENVEYMKEVSSRQILSFDSDITGVKNSQQITKLFGFDYCNVPKEYLKEDIKDWADLAKAHGMKAIENHLKQKGLL
jgi:hypothetical protein